LRGNVRGNCSLNGVVKGRKLDERIRVYIRAKYEMTRILKSRRANKTLKTYL